jgi:hypothetical protein|tara:strand:+ start:2209 stop:2835 length:627 start_codon:yes stop_codon:yes gene_type:complete
MTYEFDDGSSSSAGSQMGPFINWHARETRDGVITSRSFSIRDEDGERTDITDQFKKPGVCFKISDLGTGWCYADGSPGVAPLWDMNDTPAKFKPQPEDRGDERWKKGFIIPVVVKIDGESVAAVWSQAGAGAFEGLKHLMKSLKGLDGDGEVCLAAMTGVDEITYKKGGTSAPIFTAKKWIEMPDCLKGNAPEIVKANKVDEEVDVEF